MTHPILTEAIRLKSSEHLMVYADALSEIGDPLADGWRGIAEAEDGINHGGWMVFEGAYAGEISWTVTIVRRKWPHGFAEALVDSPEAIGSLSGYTHFKTHLAALTAAAVAYTRVRDKEMSR